MLPNGKNWYKKKFFGGGGGGKGAITLLIRGIVLAVSGSASVRYSKIRSSAAFPKEVISCEKISTFPLYPTHVPIAKGI